MNKRQAKKKRKKEQQRADYAALVDAIAELPAIARKFGEAMRDALDRLREALSEINIEEVCKQIQEQREQREQGEQDGA